MKAELPAGLREGALAECIAEAAQRPLLLALSGGGDSMALLHLLAERVPPARVHALIVDHAVRDGSAAEAACAARAANALGADAKVVRLAWDGAPASEARMRRARYAALCAAAHASGAVAIAVAHTLDDQAETMLLRAQQGSGWRGLAGIAPLAPAPIWPEGRGLVLLRPLLGVRRQALRDWLQQRGVRWGEDPSNQSQAYARVRMRAELARAGVDPALLARIGEGLRRQVAEESAGALRWIADHVRFDRGVAVWSADAVAPMAALRALLAAVSGQDYAPAADEIERLSVRLETAGAATLGGCKVARRGGAIWARRDPGAVLGRAGLPPVPERALEGPTVWDGRVALTPLTEVLSVRPRAGDADEPEVCAHGEPMPLAAAEARGLVQAQWLLEAHISHILFTPP